MKRCIAMLVFVGSGCASSKVVPEAPVPLEAHRSSSAEVAEPYIFEWFEGDFTGLEFSNPPAIQGSSDPLDGVSFAYARVGSANSRSSPVDIQIHLEDADGAVIHGEHETDIAKIYDQIYAWEPSSWESELAGRPQAAETIQAKSNLFWESLAQHVAERIFDEAITAPILVYGPGCVDDEEVQTCSSGAIPEAERVVVRTTIDGARDPLNPASRSIVYVAERGNVRQPEIFLEIKVPGGLHVASPHQEHLDFRPEISESRDGVQEIRVRAHIPSGTKDRVSNTDYPDYNLLFVPLRHLVFQGPVDDPKGPEVSMTYSDPAALQSAFDDLILDLRDPSSAVGVTETLQPFLTSDYYYMFDMGEGVGGYRDYILGEYGIAGGISPDVGQVELILVR